jgi:NADH:ubiquinone reductase (non-electrogenic)
MKIFTACFIHVSITSFLLSHNVSAFSPSASASYPSNSQTRITTELNAKEICVLGGGFGGLNAALTLSSLPWPEDDKPTITLIDKKERFVFLPLLYELCMGDAELEEVAPTYESLLRDTNIQFRQANIQGIDIDNDTVFIDNESSKFSSTRSSTSTIKYDSLIVATGADVNLERIPGAASRALPFYSIEDCLELRKRLTLLDSIGDDFDDREIEVVIVGGGYSGVELALNMKERLANVGKGVKVSLVHRGADVLEYATEYNRRSGLERLNAAGVEIVTETSVVEVMDGNENDEDTSTSTSKVNMKGMCKVVVENKNNQSKKTLNADILLWTAGAMSTNTRRGILNSKLPRDSSGRIITDQYLAAKGSGNVFALGDCSRAKKVPYVGTAAVAMQQAPFAAWNVYSYIMMMAERNENGYGSQAQRDNMKPLPFQYVNLGEMMTLGEKDATISSMGLVEVNGAAASVMRRLIYAVRMPTVQQALTAAISSSSKRFESLLVSRKKKNGAAPAGSKKKIIEWR